MHPGTARGHRQRRSEGQRQGQGLGVGGERQRRGQGEEWGNSCNNVNYKTKVRMRF